MKIEQLHLHNWRGFEGEQQINFSTDEKKNINLIIAENGTGKSNLMEAIYWCLYDELPPNANTQEEMITDSASVRNLKAKVQVKIVEPRENKTSEIKIIDGAGHLSTIDYPEEFTKILSAFLTAN